MSEAAQPSLKTYLVVYALLMLGLVATVGAAYLPLGDFNILVAMGIAFAKATLVVLYFMHVLYSPKLTWIGIFAGLVWLAIMLSLVGADYMSRDWIPLRPPTDLAEPPDDDSFQPPREASAPTAEGVPHAEQ